MDRNEKKRLRDYIGEHLDVSHARLTDGETAELAQFVDDYDEHYKGRTETRTSCAAQGRWLSCDAIDG